jgi:thiosulfate/3-mercaptopyruvate sulfurtransferase
MRQSRVLPIMGLLAGAIVSGSEPWANTDVLEPAQAATNLRDPLIIHIGFPVLYRSVHISGSIYAGPGSEPKGIDDLKKAVAGQPRMREIILYCGCCPWDKCPNVRPAFAVLRQMGYTNVKVLHIPTNLKADWIDRGYPTEKRAGTNQ